MYHLNISDPVFQRYVAHLHSLGPRALAEFLLEIATANSCEVDMSRRLETYQRLAATALFATGGDRFPRTIWRAA